MLNTKLLKYGVLHDTSSSTWENKGVMPAGGPKSENGTPHGHDTDSFIAHHPICCQQEMRTRLPVLRSSQETAFFGLKTRYAQLPSSCCSRCQSFLTASESEGLHVSRPRSGPNGDTEATTTGPSAQKRGWPGTLQNPNPRSIHILAHLLTPDELFQYARDHETSRPGARAASHVQLIGESKSAAGEDKSHFERASSPFIETLLKALN